MAAPVRFTKVKIAAGYSLLLIILFFSLLFVHREMGRLSDTDDAQNLQTDSLLLLLREKDETTLQMIRLINRTHEEAVITPHELEEIIAEQDTVVTQQRVQHRIITKRDSVITRPKKKKGFFKRLAEVFVPPAKGDSAVLINTAVEFATDTILEPYNAVDSLHQKIRTVSQKKREARPRTNYANMRLRQLNQQLTARIDSMIRDYEQVVLVHTREVDEAQQEARSRSTAIIGGIAIGAVLLSVFFLIIIWRDITRSNRYRRELEQANARAESLLVAREKLMLAITHDFKAPLGSIIGYTDLLSHLTTDERQRFYLDNMKSSSEHLLKLVSDLLDFHRLDLNKAEVNRVTFNPSQLFEEIRVSFEPLVAAKGLRLKYQIDPELDGRFISDPLRIRQVVNNLLSNAVKFTPEGEVSLIITYSSSRVRIEVADTGKGMASGDRERIFQEFTRLPGAQGEEGFGLGLSIVHKLVTLLEGSIDVQSVLGKGSRFIITLPLYPVGNAVDEVPSVRKHDDGNVVQAATGMPYPVLKNVLLIDDDRIQLTLTSAMLEQQGIHTVCCGRLDELTEQLRRHTFDLLLTDVQMPEINGFDLLKLLRASNISQARTIPIIAVTARSEMSEEDFKVHGFAGCLHKPFTVKELIQSIGQEVTPRQIEEGVEPVGDNEPLSSTPSREMPYNFATLTAFSEDDQEAARSIIHTFVEETEKNIDRMKEALRTSDVNGIAAMAHKLLPLFTLIGASGLLPQLTWLEACRNDSFSDEIAQNANLCIVEAQHVVDAARAFEDSLCM